MNFCLFSPNYSSSRSDADKLISMVHGYNLFGIFANQFLLTIYI